MRQHDEPSDRAPLLQVNEARTCFHTSRGRLVAVDGVTFDLVEGETLGIVGESGSGKSVLVRTVMNLLASNAQVSSATTIVFDGRDVRSLRPAEARHFWGTEMAMVFQDPMTSLNPVKKIGRQLTESMRFHLGLGRREATARAVHLLQRVGIPEPERRLDQYPHELSGGMRQRVTIAIALACSPRLLIADEPTTALDVTVQKQILDLLDELQEQEGMAMILITHDLGVVAGHADRVAIMYAGQVVETATTARLFNHYQHPYTEALLKSIPRIEDPSHAPLEAINGRPPDMVNPVGYCRFAPRCRAAQQRCLEESPTLDEVAPGHSLRCFFPVGSEHGERARQDNEACGVTATGLSLTSVEVA